MSSPPPICCVKHKPSVRREFPSVSGTACVHALIALGFVITRSDGLTVVLTKAARKVVVHVKPRLAEDEVALLLVAAHVELDDFVEALARAMR